MENISYQDKINHGIQILKKVRIKYFRKFFFNTNINVEVSLNLRSSALNTGQEPLPEAWVTSFSPLLAQARLLRVALHSLATCDAPLHLQQASFLLGSVQPRDSWPYPWHLKHRATSTCSRMRQFTDPTLSLPSPS